MEMEGEVGPISSSTATTTHSGPPSPPHDIPDPDFTPPVGSPDHEHALPEIHALPSDDDHDRSQEQEQEQEHEQDQEQDQGHDRSGGAGVLTEDLKHKIIKQVEYYFSDDNLQTDKYMMGFIKKNKEGFVPIAVIASFRKLKKLIRDYSLIAAALRESSFLVVSSNGKRVKRLNPLPSTEVRDPKLYTVLVENLPEDHSVENIQRIFGEAGKINNLCIRDPHAAQESARGNKPEMLISSKLHALVEYDTLEAAEKAVATLNDEQDWRNGMQVKLLKRMGKYGQRRQAWRAPDSEKNSTSRASDHAGDEEHNLNEHHDDTPDEEDGEHLSKEKNGPRGRNRGGRSRRPNYRGINGLGHGSHSSTHSIEASKPPPGPKMPDGTRGFTLGRGRPPIANQN